MKDPWSSLIQKISDHLGKAKKENDRQTSRSHLMQFLARAREEKAFVFIAMHGGEGENGTLQRHLEAYQIPYNGSGSEASALCMDKYLTGQAIQRLSEPDLISVPKKSIYLSQYEGSSKNEFEQFWKSWSEELCSHKLIIKPRSDGCSAGIVLLESGGDLERYCRFYLEKTHFIPPFTFSHQASPIEMPTFSNGEFLLEPYIETDLVVIQHDRLEVIPKEGWLELTVGVLEENGVYHALNPSITIAEGAILSLEEKFQGGTGINLTPPPEEILSSAATAKIKRLVEKAAKGLKIQNYARLDIFFNRFTEKMVLIEANTLPGLTPSTVIYHQGLAEERSLTPLALLDRIISSKLKCS
jgi:D-alanine-D-alanine ligase-like ATP-grasp enzyme